MKAPGALHGLLLQAATHDVNWVYHHIMGPADREAFDAWLVAVQHPLAYQPGTNERRFKTVARSYGKEGL